MKAAMLCIKVERSPKPPLLIGRVVCVRAWVASSGSPLRRWNVSITWSSNS